MLLLFQRQTFCLSLNWKLTRRLEANSPRMSLQDGSTDTPGVNRWCCFYDVSSKGGKWRGTNTLLLYLKVELAGNPIHPIASFSPLPLPPLSPPPPLRARPHVPKWSFFLHLPRLRFKSICVHTDPLETTENSFIFQAYRWRLKFTKNGEEETEACKQTDSRRRNRSQREEDENGYWKDGRPKRCKTCFFAKECFRVDGLFLFIFLLIPISYLSGAFRNSWDKSYWFWIVSESY